MLWWCELGLRADEFSCYDLDGLLIASTPCEFHDAVRECKERIVLAHADVRAGIILRTALPKDDVACDDALAAEFLDTQTLTLRVSAVTRGSKPLLMRKAL
jgi:hypothetical protein